MNLGKFEPSVDALEQDLRRVLEARGQRCTAQRAAVYRFLHGTDIHPTAEEVFLRVRGELPGISLATVLQEPRNAGRVRARPEAQLPRHLDPLRRAHRTPSPRTLPSLRGNRRCARKSSVRGTGSPGGPGQAFPRDRLPGGTHRLLRPVRSRRGGPGLKGTATGQRVRAGSLARPPAFRGSFRADPTAIAAHSVAAGPFSIRPTAVAVPTDAEDVQTLITWAARQGTPVVPRGAASRVARWVTWGRGSQ